MGLGEHVVQLTMMGEINLGMKPTLGCRELEKTWVLDAMVKLLGQATLKPSLASGPPGMSANRFPFY